MRRSSRGDKIHVIVGVDPGTTTGIAVLDLEGNLVEFRSKKEFSKSSIREFIVSKGRPVLVAADVEPAPSFVEKLAATFSAELYYPEEDLSVEEKEGLTEDYDVELDSHSRDALAAAVAAYNSIKDVLERIRNKSEEMDVDQEEVVERFFRKGGSVHQIARGLKDEEEENQEIDEGGVDRDWESIAGRYKDKLERKDKEVSRLRDYKDSLEEKVEELEAKNQELEEDREKEVLKSEEVDKWRSRAKNREKTIHKLEKKIESKEEDIEHLREVLESAYKGMDLVTIADSRSEIAGADESIIAVRGKKIKPASGVKVVIVEDEDMAEFYQERGVRVVLESEIDCLKTENFYLVKNGEIEEKIEEKSDQFMDWLEDYRSRS